MISRRTFIRNSTALAVGVAIIPSLDACESKKKITSDVGIQLYTVRKEMDTDARGTLKSLSELGFKEIESARSQKGNYYGLTPQEIKQVCGDLGMVLRSGHIHIDEKWQETLDLAAESGQEYIICSTMPTEGQTVDNYKKVADAFNKTGEECKKRNLKFGYHNHQYEFEQENGQVLFDVLLQNTDASLVHFELDLGWAIVAGKDPLEYFKNFPKRFPLWHLKDMDMQKKSSTEFGKGGLKIAEILNHQEESGLKYFFVEQEEYTSTPLESMKINMDYLKTLS